MTSRAFALAAVFGGALLLLALYLLYRRRAGGELPERLDVDELGLTLMDGCCAFVVFTTPSCRPCRAALKVVHTAVAATDGLVEVRTVDAMQQLDLALRYDVVTVPTIFLITASGHVLRRWREVPTRDELTASLVDP